MVLIDISYGPEALRHRRRRRRQNTTTTTADQYPSSVPQAQNYRFQYTLVHCIGANDEAGDSSAWRSTLDFGIRGNAMPVIIRRNECPLLGSPPFSPATRLSPPPLGGISPRLGAPALVYQPVEKENVIYINVS